MLFLLNMAEGHDFCIAKLAQCSLSDPSELKSTHQNGLPGPGLVSKKDVESLKGPIPGEPTDTVTDTGHFR